jgi:hypothetical protein
MKHTLLLTTQCTGNMQQEKPADKKVNELGSFQIKKVTSKHNKKI